MGHFRTHKAFVKFCELTFCVFLFQAFKEEFQLPYIKNVVDSRGVF